ncbi:hypothetical protein cypCar_00038846 [Cyprinus carpio]|nr:hypothetical protein cypCar_00038846 [Cyprinus carpio]
MKSETRSAEAQVDSSSCWKRKAVDSLLSDPQEKRERLELSPQDVCDLIHYITLRRSHSVRRPSWFGVSDERVSRVNVMVLDGLTQSHFYRYFSVFRHLRNRYSARWTLAPSSGDPLTSDLLSAEVTVCDRAAETRVELPAAMRWHPVIRRFGLSTTGLTNFLLTQQEMIKQKYPVKGGQGCEGFMCTESDGGVTDSSPLFGLDCEMCLTCAGLEVTRVALVDSSGRCVLDELVKPPNPIIDYCTSRQDGSGRSRTRLTRHSRRISQDLLQCCADAVLLVHPHVVDTSLLYRQEFGRRFKLRHLAQVVLKREIQSEVRIGHDPCEDALAALHLAQYFIRKGPRKVVEDHLEDLWDLECPEDDDSDHVISSKRHSSPLRFGHALSRSGQSAVFLGGSVETSGSLSNQQCRRHRCSSDREVCERLQQMCVLYVGPLPSDATETLVHRLLKRCGHLRTVRLLHYTHEVHAEVVFVHLEGAQLALEHLNGLQINGCIIKGATAGAADEKLDAKSGKGVTELLRENCLDLS